MARFVGRENVRKRLAPLEGEQGRTSYANGVVRIELPGEAIVVRPPFGLAHEHEYGTVRLARLLAALTDDHIVAALLVRLGGYAVGVFDGERLVASKVGSRFVQNRHKKGGSSATARRARRRTPCAPASTSSIRRRWSPTAGAAVVEVGLEGDLGDRLSLALEPSEISVLVLASLAEDELGLLVLELRPLQLVARDLQRERCQMLARETRREVGRRKSDISVLGMHVWKESPPRQTALSR